MSDRNNPKSNEGTSVHRSGVAIEGLFRPVETNPAMHGRGAHRAVVDRIERRARLMQALETDAAQFDALVRRQPDPDATRHSMAAVVAEKTALIRQLDATADEDGRPRIGEQPVQEQYRMLATAGYVEPTNLFGHIPETPSPCQLEALIGAMREGAVSMSAEQAQAFDSQRHAVLRSFAARFHALTGRTLAPGDVPTVGEVTARKAPVPLRPAWTSALASREARALNAEPPSAAEPKPPTAEGTAPTVGDPERHAMTDGAGTGADGMTAGDSSDANAGASSTEASNEAARAEAAALRHHCDANEIMMRAGRQPLRPPADGEPRYTFPGQLLQREDIFYDYALVVPVDECGPYGDEVTGYEERSLTMVRAIAAEAESVLDFLDSLGLSATLGRYLGAAPNQPQTVADEVRSVLSTLIGNVDHRTPLHQIQDWRRRISEYAVLLRSAARRHLFVSALGSVDPRDFLAALDTALADVPPFQRYREDEIRGNEVDEGLHQSTYLEVDGRRIGNVRAVHGTMSLDENDQRRNLKPYLEYLGGPFHTILTELVQAAARMRNAVADFQGGSEEMGRDFAHMASGKINEAIFVLARLLDDISEQLPLWTHQRMEGSKRLGLLVVFRQYWTPEGYVKGKLVGHKNLMPAQRETIRRRTFLQTTTERTAVQEFVRTREEQLDQTRKETSELLRENATNFNMSVSASGGFNFAVGSLDIASTTGLELSNMSRTTQSAIAEASMKSVMAYNEKREVKIREQTQFEEELESQVEVSNPNQEITANYFYYQLLRQYLVTVQLHDMRPVLLRTRYAPSESAIDDKFLSDHAHILVHALPGQLAADLRGTVHEIDALSRHRLRAQADYDQRKLAYDALRGRAPAGTLEEARDREGQLASLLEGLNGALEVLNERDDAYLKARARIDRVLGHVRKNRCHYMQFIWQASPNTDDDKILRTETFRGTPLPELTRGLQRQGYYGNEELFEFTGPSVSLTDALTRVLKPGSEIASMPREQLEQTSLFQQLRRYYTDEELDDVLAQIGNHNFVVDPAGASSVLSSRRVQIAQDAVVVEAMPGNVPLLEGFKMAHRMLNVERACLENEHLGARIADRPWRTGGEDVYRVYRRDGQPAPVGEEGPRADGE